MAILDFLGLGKDGEGGWGVEGERGERGDEEGVGDWEGDDEEVGRSK